MLILRTHRVRSQRDKLTWMVREFIGGINAAIEYCFKLFKTQRHWLSINRIFNNLIIMKKTWTPPRYTHFILVFGISDTENPTRMISLFFTLFTELLWRFLVDECWICWQSQRLIYSCVYFNYILRYFPSGNTPIL